MPGFDGPWEEGPGVFAVLVVPFFVTLVSAN